MTLFIVDVELPILSLLKSIDFFKPCFKYVYLMKESGMNNYKLRLKNFQTTYFMNTFMEEYINSLFQ